MLLFRRKILQKVVSSIGQYILNIAIKKNVYKLAVKPIRTVEKKL